MTRLKKSVLIIFCASLVAFIAVNGYYARDSRLGLRDFASLFARASPVGVFTGDPLSRTDVRWKDLRPETIAGHACNGKRSTGS